MSLRVVRCRSCGEDNFVELPEGEVVQIGIPLDLYDDVLRLIVRKTPKPIRGKRGPTVPAADLERARELKARGATMREIAATMGWSLGSTSRRLNREYIP